MPKKLKDDIGADVRVIDSHTIKPLDKDAVITAAKPGRIVCAQDGNIIGGLGHHVAAALIGFGASCKLKMFSCGSFRAGRYDGVLIQKK